MRGGQWKWTWKGVERTVKDREGTKEGKGMKERAWQGGQTRGWEN